MSSQEILLRLFSSVFGMLTAASLIGAYLRRRIAPGAQNPGIDNLNTRIKAWWFMIATLALVFWIGQIGIVALFALVSLQCLREFTAQSPPDKQGDRRLQAGLLVGLLLQYALLLSHEPSLMAVLIPLYAFVLLPIITRRKRDSSGPVQHIANAQWSLVFCVYCISHVPALLMLDVPGHEDGNMLLVAFLVLVVQSSDVFQYVWGKLLGKHCLLPQISPSKTLEGLLGGISTSTAIGAAFWWITPFSPWQAALIALTISVFGFLGGVMFSVIKRDFGIKDWGRLISGHGGMLDRVDSIVLSAPVFFYIIRLGWS